MKIATFNINGINTRLANLLEWLAPQASDHAPAWIVLSDKRRKRRRA